MSEFSRSVVYTLLSLLLEETCPAGIVRSLTTQNRKVFCIYGSKKVHYLIQPSTYFSEHALENGTHEGLRTDSEYPIPADIPIFTSILQDSDNRKVKAFKNSAFLRDAPPSYESVVEAENEQKNNNEAVK